jgi:predicted transposase YbfD/YdcC
MLVIALAASVCGAESCVDFAEFAEDREVLLREFLSLENGLPSHDTFSRLFRLLDPQAFGRVFAAFLDDLGADGPGVLATSGKTLRRSFDRAAGRSPLHVVTAFGAQARLVIGQSAVPPGGNEITAARALLETLCLEGALVTADAIHAQAETAALILQRGGDYLLALKGNHPLLAAEVAGHFADKDVKLEEYQTVDADHGRIETRIPTIEELSLPAIVKTLAMTKRGLIMFVGATGTGDVESRAVVRAGAYEGQAQRHVDALLHT